MQKYENAGKVVSMISTGKLKKANAFGLYESVQEAGNSSSYVTLIFTQFPFRFRTPVVHSRDAKAARFPPCCPPK
jgi:hypothetical protein